MFIGFDSEHAKKYGTNEAIIINSFQWWIQKNIMEGRNHHDGRTWTYNSVSALSKHFDFLTPKQVRTALDHLVECEVIVKGNYNENGYDRKLWYAFNDEKQFLKFTDGYAPQDESTGPTGHIDLPSEPNAFAPQGQPIAVNTHLLHSNNSSNNILATTSLDDKQPELASEIGSIPEEDFQEEDQQELQPPTKSQEVLKQKKESISQQDPGKPKSKKQKAKKEIYPVDLTYAEAMLKKILVVRPNLKPPNLNSWANTIRQMREVDKRSYDDIKTVFLYANSDEFWYKVILSPSSLRKHFDTIDAQREDKKRKGHKPATRGGSTYEQRGSFRVTDEVLANQQRLGNELEAIEQLWRGQPSV